MPKRIQFKRQKGHKNPPNTVMVCRPSRFGNPFNWQDEAKIFNDYQRKFAAKRKFALWLTDDRLDLYPERHEWILDNLDKIRKADYVACYCGLDEPCHADVLIGLATRPVNNSQ